MAQKNKVRVLVVVNEDDKLFRMPCSEERAEELSKVTAVLVGKKDGDALAARARAGGTGARGGAGAAHRQRA